MPEENMKKPKAVRSLTVSLAVAFVVVSLGVLLVAISLEMFFNVQSQQNLISGQQNLIAQSAADTVKNYIQEKFSLLRATVNFSTLMTISPENQTQVLSRALGLEPAFRQLMLLDTQGRKLAGASRTSEEESLQITNQLKNSELIAQVKEDKDYLSPIYIYETTSEPMVIVAVPVKNILGDFQGALLAELNLKFMWDVVGGIKIGDKGATYVVDRQGDLIAHGDASRVLKGENLTHLDEVSEFVRGSEAAHDLKSEISKGIQSNSVVTTHIHLDMPDWAVVVELPVTEAYRTVIQLAGFAGLILILSIVLALLVGLFFSKRITKPIIHLRDAAAEISRGKWETRINIASNDEIGQLAEAFNQMASKLQQSYQNLEQKVAERTNEVDAAKVKLEKQQEALLNVLQDVNLAKAVGEEQSRSLLGTINEGIVVTDEEGAIDYVNTAFQRIFELPAEFATGKKFEEIFNVYDFKKKPLETKSISDTEFSSQKGPLKMYLETTKGKQVPVILGASAIEVEKKYKGVLRIIHDYTEELTLQQQKDDFFSIASHELRTPLTIIGGNLDNLIQGYGGSTFTEVDKELLKDMVDASDRLIDMVNDFLNVSRLEQGRIKPTIVPVDLCALTQKVVAEVQPMAQKKGLSVTYHCDQNHANVLGDEDKLREVLTNLIGNSLKFTKEGGITITHRVEGNMLVTTIVDTGMGVAKQRQDLLFQRFQQAMERTLAREAGGTGLGLYISREFMRLMDGDLWLVESGEGKGRRFAFKGPLAKAS